MKGNYGQVTVDILYK